MRPSFNSQDVIAHVTSRIEGAVIEEDPFPHFVVTELFPPDIGERRRRVLMFGCKLRTPDALRLFGPSNRGPREGAPAT